jgi:capsular polysaccharide biosynthesis protein
MVKVTEQETTYLIQRKICRGMICTFVVSLVLISSVSITFFFVFLDTTLKMSVESIFYAHTYSIVGDIIQVKKNDFMLS